MKIIIMTKDDFIFIDQDDIMAITDNEGKTQIITSNETIEISKTIDEVREHFPGMYMVKESTYINTNHIKKIDQYFIHLESKGRKYNMIYDISIKSLLENIDALQI